MTRTIVIFSTYAPSEEFGGPARIFHMRRVIERRGHRVSHVVIDTDGVRGATTANDLRITASTRTRPIDHLYTDVELGATVGADQHQVDKVVAYLRRQRADLVILEQPFLVPVVRRALAQVPIPVLYSCQNVEYQLRKDLEQFSPMRTRSPLRYEEVRALEIEAVAMSAAVTSICTSDQTRLQLDFGVESVVVPNGSTVAEARLDLQYQRDHAYFAFAGSSYWPNTEGFADIATPSLAFLPPNVRIEICGSVCKALLDHRRLLNHSDINLARMSMNGFVPMNELIGLMVNSIAVLVPVFLGEGSNLKSADALACGAPVIMTRRATHGYEDVLAIDDEGVTVVDTPAEFRAAMKLAVATGRPSGLVGAKRRQMLAWSNRLQPLATLIETLG